MSRAADPIADKIRRVRAKTRSSNAGEAQAARNALGNLRRRYPEYFADDVRAPAQLLPEPPAQHRHRLGAGQVLAALERAPDRRAGAEHVEQLGRGGDAGEKSLCTERAQRFAGYPPSTTGTRAAPWSLLTVTPQPRPSAWPGLEGGVPRTPQS